MKSHSMAKHFLLLQEQRIYYLPAIQTLSQEELWHRPYEGKWSIGEHFYHLYLILKMLHTATKYSLFLTPIAKLQRNKPFATEIHDIYAAYKLKKGKGMPAPKILIPPKKIYFALSSQDIEQTLMNETLALQWLVKNIEEDIAGHIRFPDPIAHYPNLIQAIQLLAIHEQHHFKIMEKTFSYTK
ncbi:DinB family protein [Lysinibacillus macroides]|uniref:Membrane protein n=1 Tax=Lysinibacillus macroides TaxID=33935 RepID=A0A0M9DIK7_9BACI|nr:DinB family protein [Lysinibacillus macroides]KOY82158.1 membrane protein [Lysinibacillus macroides]QPR68264.1 DinB family protein [Lysinibacillus macroides]